MFKFKITHHPRDTFGQPLPMAPIEFTCTAEDIQSIAADRLNRPYKAFDGSVCYPVFDSEIVTIDDEEDTA